MHHIDTLTLKPAPDAEPAAGDGRGVPPSLGRGGPRPEQNPVPPLVIRGSVFTPPEIGRCDDERWKSVSVGVGWVSLTAPDTHLEALEHVMTCLEQAPPDTLPGQNHYTHTLAFPGGTKIYHGGDRQRDTLSLQIPGAIADRWTASAFRKNLAPILEVLPTWKATRLDLFIDVEGEHLRLLHRYDAARGSQWPRRMKSNGFRPEDAEGSYDGWTVYFGKRGNGQSLLRVYDKSLEQNRPKDLHHRIEAELHSGKAHNALTQLLTTPDDCTLSQTITDYVLGLVSFREPDNTTPSPWFTQLLEALDAVPRKIGTDRVTNSAESFLETFQRQYAPRLLAGAHLAGLDPREVFAALLSDVSVSDRIMNESKTRDLADLLRTKTS